MFPVTYKKFEITEKLKSKMVMVLCGKYLIELLKKLDPKQQKILLFLVETNADEIETGLFRRLMDKSCYVFEILQQSSVIIVPFQNSAHEAVERAQLGLPEVEKNDVENNLNKLFPLYLINQGVIIPRNTNCAIDTSLHQNASLSL